MGHPALAGRSGFAAALSCLRPDAVTLYEQARDSEDAYYIVRGELQITGPVDEPDPETVTQDVQAKIYDISLVIFADDFETGDTSYW